VDDEDSGTTIVTEGDNGVGAAVWSGNDGGDGAGGHAGELGNAFIQAVPFNADFGARSGIASAATVGVTSVGIASPTAASKSAASAPAAASAPGRGVCGFGFGIH